MNSLIKTSVYFYSDFSVPDITGERKNIINVDFSNMREEQFFQTKNTHHINYLFEYKEKQVHFSRKARILSLVL